MMYEPSPVVYGPQEPKSLQLLQVPRPAGGTTPTPAIAPSSSHMPLPQTPPASLQGISSGYQNTVEYNACQMKGVFVPSSSPYDIPSNVRAHTSAMVEEGGDTQNDPLIGGSVNNRQVRGTHTLFTWILNSISS